MRCLVALLLALHSFFVFSAESLIKYSAKRLPDESVEQAYKRVRQYHPAMHDSDDTPWDKQQALSQIDFSKVPEIASYDQLLHYFYTIRDTRFLQTDADPDFQRRIHWLYPDDGCYVRAELASVHLKEEQLTRPFKLFVFGGLSVKTPYSPDGSVYWWYHVAEVVQYMGSVYVLDPAINQNAPLLVEDWYARMGNPNQFEGAVCNEYAYTPFSTCDAVTSENEDDALDDAYHFLDAEWSRMQELGFDPILVLGDSPPWL